MSFELHCAPMSSGPSVAPCVDVSGTSYAPVMASMDLSTIDYVNGGALMAWVITVTLSAYLIGLTVGAIVRVIRSA